MSRTNDASARPQTRIWLRLEAKHRYHAVIDESEAAEAEAAEGEQVAECTRRGGFAGPILEDPDSFR